MKQYALFPQNARRACLVAAPFPPSSRLDNHKYGVHGCVHALAVNILLNSPTVGFRLISQGFRLVSLDMNVRTTHHVQVVLVMHVTCTRAFGCTLQAGQVFNDNDMVLNTSGQGPVFLSRAFNVLPGSGNVAIRYRFVTEEFPVYYGTVYDDTFSVLVRSKKLGAIVLQAASSLNTLPSSAYTLTPAVRACMAIASPQTIDIILLGKMLGSGSPCLY
jgi:hypothetical protein